MRLISPQTIAFTAEVTEDEIRARMAAEVLESIGALDADGKAVPGVEVTVNRGSGRAGGYVIKVTGPAPARVAMIPKEI